MGKKDKIVWLQTQCNWPNKDVFDATAKIFLNLEPESEHILAYYQETGIVIAPDGDFPSPESIRMAHPQITDIAIISIYDSLLKFDLNKPV